MVSVLIAVAILGYSAWIIVRKIRQGRRMWKAGVQRVLRLLWRLQRKTALKTHSARSVA